MSSIFRYKARDPEGNLLTGKKEAETSKEVARMLNNDNLIAVEIREIKKTKKKKKKAKKDIVLFGAVKDKEVAVFCRQFSTMIGAGVSVAEAIEDLSHAVDNPRFRNILKKILESVRSGSSLSEAFSRHSSVFSTIFVQMIGAGEESGKLSEVLNDLSLYLEKKVKLKGQLRSASMYPVFVGGFFLVILIGLVFFLIPQFRDMFDSLGAELPVPTQIVMNISDFLVHNIPYFIIALVASIIGFIAFYKTSTGRFMIDSIKLKIPLFGNITLRIILARFFQTLATLLKSGVDVVAALDVAAKVSYNARIEKKVEMMKEGIIEGESLSRELAKSGLFPRLTVSMTAVGEKSGSIDKMLVKISDYYTEEVDAEVEGFSSMIEPVLIISLGLIVGVFVITMYLPIFQMAGAMATGA